MNLLRWAVRLLFALGLVFLGVAVALTVAPKSYRAAVRIKAEPEKPASRPPGNGFFSFRSDPFWIPSEFERIHSKVILFSVITNLHLDLRWTRDGKRLEIGIAYLLLKERLDVRQARNTPLFEISVRSRQPGEAAEIANEIARVYRDFRQRAEVDPPAGGYVQILEPAVPPASPVFPRRFVVVAAWLISAGCFVAAGVLRFTARG